LWKIDSDSNDADGNDVDSNEKLGGCRVESCCGLGIGEVDEVYICQKPFNAQKIRIREGGGYAIARVFDCGVHVELTVPLGLKHFFPSIRTKLTAKI
jgi:hypothetical protein